MVDPSEIIIRKITRKELTWIFFFLVHCHILDDFHVLIYAILSLYILAGFVSKNISIIMVHKMTPETEIVMKELLGVMM